jgi:hypothetical protein
MIKGMVTRSLEGRARLRNRAIFLQLTTDRLGYVRCEHVRSCDAGALQRVPRRGARCPSPLKIEAAELPGHIHHFSNEK